MSTAGKNVKKLRDDLEIGISLEDDGSVVATNPESGRSVRFDEREAYFLNALREPHNETVVIARYNAKFGEQATQSDLHAFVDRLASLGFLQGIPGDANPPDDSVVDLQAASEPRRNRSGQRAKPVPEDTSPAAPATPKAMAAPTSEPSEEPRAESKTPKKPGFFPLFNPTGLFDFLLAIFGFLRYFAPVLPVIAGVATLGLFLNRVAVSQDLAAVTLNLSLVNRLIFTMLTISLGNAVFSGLTGRFYRLETPTFGIMMVFAILPRFTVPVRQGPGTPDHARLQVTAAPLRARVLMFSAGSLIWLVTRAQGGQLPQFGLSLALFSCISFLILANPLLGGAGYKLLSERFNCPDLRDRAFRMMRVKMFGAPDSIVQNTETSTAVRVYALASVLFVLLLLGFIFFGIATSLELNYGGLGVVAFLILAGIMAWQLRKQVAPEGVRVGTVRSARSAPRARADERPGLIARIRAIPRRRLVILAILGVVMFLPYRYEAGGSAEVLPLHRNGIYMQYPGVIEDVYFDGGEWLEEGTVIARMANFRQQRDVDVTIAQIEMKQEELNTLLTTPSPEVVELATKELETAKIKLLYSEKNAERVQSLHGNKTVADATLEDALEEVELARQEVLEREENLRVVKSQINPHQIEAVRAEIRLLERELAYYREVLARTELTMPFDGRLVTMHLQDLENTYLDENDLFAEAEDSSKFHVEIEIPEFDIGLVSIGDEIRLKLQLAPGETVIGEVTAIFPASEETDYGNVITVLSIIDNEDNKIHSGMTGFAKIDGEEMRVYEAFGRALLRFIQIEIWSWLP